MRDILFRGKRIDNGEWVYGYLVSVSDFSSAKIFVPHLPEESKFATMPISVVSDTVGQYTGLTDAVGTKIFENDIIRSPKGVIFGAQYDFVVKFIDGLFFGEGEHFLEIKPKHFDSCFVIGNIHDNPDMA